MVKIIETNLSIMDRIIMDHQSRMVEAESWDSYVDFYFNHAYGYEDNREFKSLTNLIGDTLLPGAKVYDLNYDDYHLSCRVFNPDEIETMKLAYLAEDDSEYIKDEEVR